MKAIILAGGFGGRLRPITEKIPKAILPVRGKSLCLYQIEWLKKYDINEIIFAIGYLGEKIKELLGDGKDLGAKISYAQEDKPLGTAGAIRNVFKKIHFRDNTPFLVINGDIITDINLFKMQDFHYKKKSLLTIALIFREDIHSYGLVQLDRDQRIKAFYEKPTHISKEGLINAGVYILDKKILEYIPLDKTYSFEKELVPELIKKDLDIYGFVTDAYFIDVGTLDRYKEAEENLESLIKQ